LSRRLQNEEQPGGKGSNQRRKKSNEAKIEMPVVGRDRVKETLWIMYKVGDSWVVAA
jgi:hypothetical protein